AFLRRIKKARREEEEQEEEEQEEEEQEEEEEEEKEEEGRVDWRRRITDVDLRASEAREPRIENVWKEVITGNRGPGGAVDESDKTKVL
ncbi:hypothetical protein VYU27_006165, partial [Nannochloropsis oceanica]